MGTNFYWKDKPEDADDMDPQWHIGKRSAAGMYCWDCDATLCEGGKAAIHQSRYGFHEQCPKCGQAPTKEGLDVPNPVSVELGFSSPRDGRPTGVRGTSSFSWAQDAEAARASCEQNMDSEAVVDEYGRVSTGREFLRMLRSNCAVEFHDSVGRYFC